MKVHCKEQLTEEELKLRRHRHRRQSNLEDAQDFLGAWIKNTGVVALIILGVFFVLGMIGFPIYLACSGFIAHTIWKIVVGIVWIIIDVGLGITLND